MSAAARLARGIVCAAALLVTRAPAAAQTSLPPAPADVTVSLEAGKTALLVLDLVESICTPQARCVAIVPKAAALIAAARKAGVPVFYSAAMPAGLVTPLAPPAFLAAVAPQAGDAFVAGAGQDRFFATNLEGLLRKRGTTTLILAGWRENGSLLYTAVGASLHGFTSVVAEDVTAAPTEADVAIGRYQLLTQLANNAKNEPLKAGAVTLSRSDLISFR